MAQQLIVARPYAKAAFEYAFEAQTLAQWQAFLAVARLITLDEGVQKLLCNPTIPSETIAKLYADITQPYREGAQQRFLDILVENKRLGLLPAIERVFLALRAEAEKVQVATVTSYFELSESDQDAIRAALKKRLQREVKLTCQVDKTILGGAIIRAGDIVIDGSVRSHLAKLRQVAIR